MDLLSILLGIRATARPYNPLCPICISGNKRDEVRRFAEPRRMICDAVSSRLKLDEFLDLLLKSLFGLCAGKTKVTHLLTVLEEKNGGD